MEIRHNISVYKTNINQPAFVKRPKVTSACDMFCHSLGNKVYKETTVKNKAGVTKNAVIKEKLLSGFEKSILGNNTHRIDLSVDGRNMGYAVYSIDLENNIFYLNEINTKKANEKGIKGGGSELIKTVIEESKKHGFNGEVVVISSNSDKSSGFYYKNNFRPTGDYSRFNPILSYSLNKGKYVNEFLPVGFPMIEMKIDEHGANALLNGNRTYQMNTSENICDDNFDNKEYNALWCYDASSNENYIQVIRKDGEDVKQPISCVAKLSPENKLSLELVNDYYVTDKELGFLSKAAEIKSKELNADGFEIIKNYDCLD